MGNAAAKQLDETVLVAGSIDGKAIAKAMVSTKATTKIKSKNKTWIEVEGETLLWSYKNKGMIKSYSIVMDSAGTPVAAIVPVKKGMTSSISFICRPVPAYDGQEALTAEELDKAGIKEGTFETLYKFAKMETTKTSISTAKCVYGLVTSADDDEVAPFYFGEKLSSMGFKAIFKQATDADNEGIPVAKAYMPGMSFSPHVEAASGVDLLAIVSIGYGLAGDESSAGALAGAGVI